MALVRLDAATVQLSFTAAAGRGYVVEQAADLSAMTLWQTRLVLDPTPSGSAVKIPVTISGADQFLRVR